VGLARLTFQTVSRHEATFSLAFLLLALREDASIILQASESETMADAQLLQELQAQEAVLNQRLNNDIDEEDEDDDEEDESIETNFEAMNDVRAAHRLNEAIKYGHPDSVIESIVEAKPGAVSTPLGAYHQNKIAIHCACKRGRSLDIIRYLLGKHPEGISLEDAEGKLPIDYACQDSRTSVETIQFLASISPDVDVYLLKGACESFASVDVLDCLIGLIPAAVTKMTNSKNGWLPLHFCAASRTATLEKVKALVLANPFTLLVESDCGKKPAQLTSHKEIRSFLESQTESQEQVLQATRKSLGEAAHRYRLPGDILELTWGFIVGNIASLKCPIAVGKYGDNEISGGRKRKQGE
jgi:hypothetical protein